MTRHRRMVYPSSYDQPLPIKVETIGYNHDQETVSRPQGYPLFHWLQTVRGEGRIVIGGRRESACRRIAASCCFRTRSMLMRERPNGG